MAKDTGSWLIGIREVMARMQCGYTHAAKLIRERNAELAKMGKIIPKRGWTYRKYFESKVYA